MTVESEHPLIPRREVDPRQELPGLELEVLRRWKERDVFAQSLRARDGAEPWVFYEGPPTANGRPGSHHVLSRVFKDIYPRYKTMRGFRVDRKGGWDCHGLPVEIAVEQQLGLTSKTEVERYGIREFNERCRESVFTYLEDWNRLTERIGFWLDLDHAYRTLDESYIESVWWALSEIAGKGLLYEGHKVVPYCPRCGTALSSHEVALGYRDVTDPSVYVRLKLLDSDESLLIWTTTPWTLPGNVAVAVGLDIEYAKVRSQEETLILASARVEEVLGDGAEVMETMPGSELVGRRYHGPLFGVRPQAPEGAVPWSILAGDFVTTEDGTGLVHLAPAFGEDDFAVAASAGLIDRDDPKTLLNPVRLDGTYGPGVIGDGGRSYEGRFVKDEQLTEDLIADLHSRGLLLKRTDYEHSYPHCWRCNTPLIYYAKASWYIKTTALREEMLAANETVAWHPGHIKQGRFGEWLKGNIDWALSRERYWGTPLPVWRCPQGHVKVIGSFSELERLSGKTLSDHHRPYVDEVGFSCKSCGEQMRRVQEVIDVWFDSGAMPFAQHHAPFENVERFRERFPADFICEALDQTRGWFYSLLAVSTLLSHTDLLTSGGSARGDAGAAGARTVAGASAVATGASTTSGGPPTADASPARDASPATRPPEAPRFAGAPYRNVVCLGLILDAEGQKMSKSKGNTVEPWQVLDDHGADAFRWYFFTSKQPWDGYRFSEEAIGEGVRLFLKQLWSTYFFYVLYANANAERLREADASDVDHGAELDRWVLSRTSATAAHVTERLDAYDATSAGREIAELLDDVSNWYVRRSRRRFWDGDPAAFATLRECLLTVSKLLAPFCPFIADEIYDNLDGALLSVHLCDFPTQEDLPRRDLELEEAMATARQTVRLGLGARGKAKVKVRQPLAEAVIVADGKERESIERLSEIVREELNVRAVRFVDAAEELGRYEVKANYRRLGPIFGKDMPLAAEAIAALDPQHVASKVLAATDGTRIGISVAGREHELGPQDLIVTMSAPEGYAVEREGAHAVALELTIDEDLKREGQAREIVHAIQNARKNAGLDVEDRIALSLSGDADLLAAARAHSDYVSGETLAVQVDIGESASEHAHRETAKIDGLQLAVSLSRTTSA